MIFKDMLFPFCESIELIRTNLDLKHIEHWKALVTATELSMRSWSTGADGKETCLPKIITVTADRPETLIESMWQEAQIRIDQDFIIINAS